MLLLITVISFANYWFFTLLSLNFILATILLIESVLLTLSFYRKNARTRLVTIILMLLLCTYALKDFDKSIFVTTNLDIDKNTRRQSYYAHELGKIYRNRLGLYYFDNLANYSYRINNKFFQNLELEQYFNRYLFIATPFLILGFGYFLINLNPVVVIYLLSSLTVTSFLNINSKVGPFLLFPFINMSISLGSIYVIKRIHSHFLKRQK